MSCKVSVPASSANLGPGFDSLALALNLYTVIDVDLCPDLLEPVFRSGDLYGGADLVQIGAEIVSRETGRKLPGSNITTVSDIPVARGLGSSAAALIGGLMVGNWLLDEPLTESELFLLAASEEGHADNIAAALFGGAALGYRSEDGAHAACTLSIQDGIQATMFVPDSIALTRDARQVVPGEFTRDDAIFTSAGVGLLVHALASGEFHLLGRAMADRMHQPYREHLFPYLGSMVSAARSAGAFGAALSGAGPTILALNDADHANEVASSLASIADQYGLAGQVHHLQIARQGAVIEKRRVTSTGGVVRPSPQH